MLKIKQVEHLKKKKLLSKHNNNKPPTIKRETNQRKIKAK